MARQKSPSEVIVSFAGGANDGFVAPADDDDGTQDGVKGVVYQDIDKGVLHDWLRSSLVEEH